MKSEISAFKLSLKIIKTSYKKKIKKAYGLKKNLELRQIQNYLKN
jgi:hypothetical protein